MFLAADYPLLDVFWTIIIFFVWVAWFMLLFRAVADVFRRRDIGGGKKTAWLIFMLFLPFLGVFAYLIANNDDMGRRDMEQMRTSQTQFDDYVRSVATAEGPATEINKAKQLLDDGTITQPEFDAIKMKALATG